MKDGDKEKELAEKMKGLRDVRQLLEEAEIECIVATVCPFCDCVIGYEPPCEHARRYMDA